jgi:capsular exopolysaccharide synthesis family protein
MVSFRKKQQPVFQNTPFAVVEAYKSLRTNMQSVSVNNSYKKIVLTSSIPDEQKTTIASNLAISLAADEKKVLLIDADLRKPSIQRYFNLYESECVGLTNLLTGKQSLENGMFTLREYGIDIITSGFIPANSAELLGSAKMKELIAELEDRYDYLIFDTPPVSIVTDAAVLSKFCNGVILVVRQRYTKKETALIAKRNLLNAGANVIGCVFSDFKPVQGNDSSVYYLYGGYGRKTSDNKKYAPKFYKGT